MNNNKIHTTNYFNTFIQVAEDIRANCGIVPNAKGDKNTVAQVQYELLVNNPYKYTSDDVIFQVYAIRNNLKKSELSEIRKVFFSKGQACMRSSPLTKNYGFGIHADENGKITLYGMETEKYKKFVNDPTIKKIKAMRTSK